MKLPKNFGGKGFTSALGDMQQAMARAQNLEAELERQAIKVERSGVTAVFDGRGEVKGIKIDPELVDPEDVETLEDLIVSAMRDGFNQATELRDAKVKEIMPNMPDLPGITR